MVSSITRPVAFLGRILKVVLPFGRRKFVIVVASMIITGDPAVGRSRLGPAVSVCGGESGEFRVFKVRLLLGFNVSYQRSKAIGLRDGNSFDCYRWWSRVLPPFSVRLSWRVMLGLSGTGSECNSSQSITVSRICTSSLGTLRSSRRRRTRTSFSSPPSFLRRSATLWRGFLSPW